MAQPPQPDWRYCQNCRTMFYDGFPFKGVCPAAPPIPGSPFQLRHTGPHVAEGFKFDLDFNTPETASAQANWRYCSKCGVMFYDGFPDKGHCMAGGAHEPMGYNFTLPHDLPGNANAQPAWRYCGACHAMYYDGSGDKGHCPGNVKLLPTGASLFDGHAAAGWNFVLPHDLPATAITLRAIEDGGRFIEVDGVGFTPGEPVKLGYDIFGGGGPTTDQAGEETLTSDPTTSFSYRIRVNLAGDIAGAQAHATDLASGSVATGSI